MGGGPRGVALVERIGAALKDLPAEPRETSAAAGRTRRGEWLDIDLIDAIEPGAGEVWQTGQTRLLCMNTLAHAVTLFTEDGASIEAQVRPGPTLYEFIVLSVELVGQQLTAEARAGLGNSLASDVPSAHRAVFESHPPEPTSLRSFMDEMRSTRPESHPSRALYGVYLRWVLSLVARWLPHGVALHTHAGRVTHITQDNTVLYEPLSTSIPASGEQPRALAAGLGSRETADAGDEADADAQAKSTGLRELRADAVILTGGWSRPTLSASEAQIAAAVEEAAQTSGADPDRQPLWIPPDSPLNQHLDEIQPGEDVIVRGLGMGFFDSMILLTQGRGGRFAPAPTRGEEHRLVYEKSGREPRLLVTSHRGQPFLPKSVYGALPPAAHLPRSRAREAQLRERFAADPSLRVDFDVEVWPLIVADAFEAHALTLLPQRAGDIATALDEALATASISGRGDVHADFAAARTALAHLVPHDQQFYPDAVAFTLARLRDLAQIRALPPELAPPAPSDSPRALTDWEATRLRCDIADAYQGAASAKKNGLWSFSAARRLSTLLGSNDRYTAESRADRLRVLGSLGGSAGSGPPAFRSRELLALVEAGVVEFAGGQPHITLPTAAEAVFTLSTPELCGAAEVPGDTNLSAPSGRRASTEPTEGAAESPATTHRRGEVRARVLLDAWMHAPDARSPQDPLLRSLKDAGRITVHAHHTASAQATESAAFHVEPSTGRAIGADGQPDARLHLVGLPLEAQLGDTTISPMPGSDPTMLREADRVARAVVSDL